MKVYSGYIKDENKLLASSSGGAATALAESIIARNGVVFGARYSDDFYSAEYCCVEDVDSLTQIKGSKYTETKKNNIYEIVEKKLSTGCPVLYIGLGCDIAAVKSYCRSQNLDSSNLYTIDILCHGPAPKEVQKNYILELEQKYHARVKDFSIRYKKQGWTPFYIRAVLDNGKVHVELFNKSDFGKAFYNIARPQCTRCKFKGSNHQGDLCVGDYWGLTDKDSGWNKNGVSIIVVQTEKGEGLLSFLGDDFSIQEADEELFLNGNPMYNNSRKQGVDYNEFMKDLNDRGLHYAISKLPKKRVPVMYRIKKAIKGIRSSQ